MTSIPSMQKESGLPFPFYRWSKQHALRLVPSRRLHAPQTFPHYPKSRYRSLSVRFVPPPPFESATTEGRAKKRPQLDFNPSLPPSWCPIRITPRTRTLAQAQRFDSFCTLLYLHSMEWGGRNSRYRLLQAPICSFDYKARDRAQWTRQ